MTLQYGGSPLGDTIETSEIANGAVTMDKLSTTVKGIIPIGGVIAWQKSIAGVPALIDNFVECNGGTVSDADSPIDGEPIPDLNGSSGNQRFLRGNTTSGTESGADTGATSNIGSGSVEFETAGGDLAIQGATGSSSGQHTHPISRLPYYHEVVWIMRIK